jgi:hypothetical protein
MTQERRHFPTVLRALCFCVAALVMLSFLTLVFEPNSDDTKTRKSFYAEKPYSLDMVCIGGSVCWMGWAPYEAWHFAGLASYTYGLSALDSFYVLPILKEVLAHQSPNLLMIDLRPFQYNGIRPKKKETGLMLLSTMPLLSPNRYEVAIKAYRNADNLTEMDTIDTFLFDLMRYHTNWAKLNGDSIRWAIPGRSVYNTKGFRILTGQAYFPLYDRSSVTDTEPVDPRGEADLRELLAYLKAHNQKALFLVVSYQETIQERMQYNYLAEIIRSEGFDYLNANDFNARMALDDETDLFNENHLNLFGAEKFTRTVAEYLKAHYALPDHRSDPAYGDWETGYRDWEKIATTTKQEILAYKAAHAAEKKDE